MPELWDAIVVGAGPAGCAAAYDLASAGQHVLLLDRAEFPRPKACAGGLTMKAVRALRYPVDPVVRRWVSSITLEESASSAVTVGRRDPVCAMTVREELDSFCLTKTIERGVEFQRVSTLLAIEQREDRVVLRAKDAEPMEARYVVGADGVHSRVRALIPDATGGAAWFRTGFAIEANVPYASEAERYPLTFDFAPVERGYGWLFPRDNHVNVGLYVEDFHTEQALAGKDSSTRDIGHPGARVNRDALDRYIAARCGADRTYSKPVGQFLGLGAAAYRPVPGQRVLLAGDAAGFVDPLTGEGLYGAIRSGQSAARAITATLGSSGERAGSTRGVRLRKREKTLEQKLPVDQGFLVAAQDLQEDLRVAEHAAKRFFVDSQRGFRLMRLPLLPRAVLKVYADGLSLHGLLRGVQMVSRLQHSRRS